MGDKTKCIYCFKEFLPIDAHFRAKAPISLIEELKEEEFVFYGASRKTKELDESDGRMIDETLKKYYINQLDFDNLTAETLAANYPFFTRDSNFIKYNLIQDEVTLREYISEIYFNKDNYTSSILSTNDRLCPHCHNKLPKGFGIKDTLVISVIGDTFSGKTVFLTVLLNELVNRQDFFQGSLVEIGEKNDLRRTIKLYTQKIYVEKELPDATPTNVVPPLLYNYTYKYIDEHSKEIKKSIDIALYDIAGENCRDNDKLDQKGYNVKNSDGLIFLINPLAINNIASYFRVSGLVTQDTNTASQLEIVNAIYNNFLSYDNKKSKIPTALVISKADMLNNDEVKLPFFENHPHSKLLTKNYIDNSKSLGFLDKEDIHNLSYDTEIFLNTMGSAPFINAIKNYFENYSFFAVSALNQMPVVKEIDDREIGIIEREIKPFRVIEPFYWILSQNGHMGFYNKKNTENKKINEKKSFWGKLFGNM